MDAEVADDKTLQAFLDDDSQKPEIAQHGKKV
jgi:hypothetical protein